MHFACDALGKATRIYNRTACDSVAFYLWESFLLAYDKGNICLFTFFSLIIISSSASPLFLYEKTTQMKWGRAKHHFEAQQ